MTTRKRLTAQDWIEAGCAALGRGGIAAVAVEPLAARLGTTKGSFYWHFANRDALLEASLAQWERSETDAVIAVVEAEPDVARRLRLLLAAALQGGPPGREGATVELALQPTADHPLVAPVLARVTRRRLDYLTAQFAALGFGPTEAARRAVLAYTSYLGHAQLAHATPGLAPDDAGYVDTVIAVLTRGA
ncbi:MAG TPA: TetR/AcrR family transcriptional regulator [Pseudonocardia sp.]|nr:TetR/AcrR family transcriptional regulator [Pseudonocardia sp.]